MLLRKSISSVLPLPTVRFHRALAASVLVALTVLCASLPTLAGEYERTFEFDDGKLVVSNLVGEVNITGGDGDLFVVTVQVRGDDAEEGLLDFEVTKGGKSSLTVKFPTDEHRKYIYPPMGRLSNCTFSYNNNESHQGSWLKKVFSGMGGDRIKVSGRGSGLEVWADITIEVPKGEALTMKNGVGEVTAMQVEGDLVLDTSSGSVTAEAIRGSLLVDTGSGSVKVDDVRGDVLVDTGSGSVHVNGVRGDLNIDTGSGSVKARRIESDEAKIDTGSGSVILELDRMGHGPFVIDTGSGSVELILPNDASARIIADTGSGGIRNKVPGADVRHKDDDRLEMRVGDGDAKVRLDTGSGSVTIRSQ